MCSHFSDWLPTALRNVKPSDVMMTHGLCVTAMNTTNAPDKTKAVPVLT